MIKMKEFRWPEGMALLCLRLYKSYKKIIAIKKDLDAVNRVLVIYCAYVRSYIQSSIEKRTIFIKNNDECDR